MQDHVDIVLLRKAHHFVECLPAIIAAMEISFIIADMTISSYKYSDCVRSCVGVSAAVQYIQDGIGNLSEGRGEALGGHLGNALWRQRRTISAQTIRRGTFFNLAWISENGICSAVEDTVVSGTRDATLPPTPRNPRSHDQNLSRAADLRTRFGEEARHHNFNDSARKSIAMWPTRALFARSVWKGIYVLSLNSKMNC